jgi:hypothetical protein
LYNPPVKPPRPFSADYRAADCPHGAPADATGRLTHDIEGRPLVAQHVVGRNMVGQGEKAISPAELDAITTTLTGNPPQSVAACEIGGDAGRLTWLRDRPDALRDYQILINRGLTQQQADRVQHARGPAGRWDRLGIRARSKAIRVSITTRRGGI